MPSTVIRSFRYDAEKSELLITFQSGRRYLYTGVPQGIFDAMKKSFSKGEFFNEHIREQFPFERLPLGS
jgi:lysyl-tRNA synthetase class 2